MQALYFERGTFAKAEVRRTTRRTFVRSTPTVRSRSIDSNDVRTIWGTIWGLGEYLGVRTGGGDLGGPVQGYPVQCGPFHTGYPGLWNKESGIN